MDSPNRMAVELVDEAIDFADELGIAVHHLDDESVVLDFGVEADGGIEAGLLLAEIQTAGLATVQTRMDHVGGAPIPHVELSTDHPLLSLLCCGKAGWELSMGDFEARASGPARLFVRDGREFRYLDRAADFDLGVLTIEADRLPDGGVVSTIATEAGLPTSGVYLPTAPAASVAGTVSMAARAAEVALHRLLLLGYDPTNVISATGSAPVVPVASDKTTATARVNDGLAYGSRVHLVVKEDADVFADLPFGATDYADGSFSSILGDGATFAPIEDAFAPASVTVDVRGGPTHVVGEIDEAKLAERIGL